MENVNRWAENDNDTARTMKKHIVFWKILLCIVFLYFLALGNYRFVRGFQYWWRNVQVKKGYVKEAERLQQEQESLKEEIYKLEHSFLAQERLAREMGYIRLGETVYKFVPKSDDAESEPIE